MKSKDKKSSDQNYKDFIQCGEDFNKSYHEFFKNLERQHYSLNRIVFLGLLLGLLLSNL